ncbi:MAG TPA: triphosphoribosyl-dephospho-CoA synthase [Methylophilaceae bacterium]
MNEIARIFENACLAELEAIKPGNVHVFADGHGMTVGDFAKAARGASEEIARQGLTVGQRIDQAVAASWDLTRCNTNLGIILLAAPLIQSAQTGEPLPQILQSLTVEDAALAFHAIQRANPAGLGKVDQYDVNSKSSKPLCTLYRAMQVAAGRDRVAFQYAYDYADVFNTGIPTYQQALERWNNATWALTATYLTFLAELPDSHVARKYGEASANQVQQDAIPHLAALQACENPKIYLGELLKFDADLKQRKINPGTSADLTVATLLAIELKR